MNAVVFFNSNVIFGLIKTNLRLTYASLVLGFKAVVFECKLSYRCFIKLGYAIPVLKKTSLNAASFS